MTTDTVRSESVTNHIIAICKRAEVSYEIFADKYGLLPKTITLKFPPNIPREFSKAEAEEAIVQYCHDNEVKYEIVSNTNQSRIFATEIKVQVGRGRALDGIERATVRRCIEERIPFHFCESRGYHHYNFGGILDDFRYEVLRATRNEPCETASYFSSGFSSTKSKYVEPVVEPTKWRKLCNKVPFLRDWLVHRDEQHKKDEIAEALNELGLSREHLRLADVT